MAAGSPGVVTALLLYTLITSLTPLKEDLDSDYASNKHHQPLYQNKFLKGLAVAYKQVKNHVKPKLGYAKCLLATTRIYPDAHKQLQKTHLKLKHDLQWTDTVIITICLILLRYTLVLVLDHRRHLLTGTFEHTKLFIQV